jgi:small-conductance mechanosensitive channel
LKIAGRSLFVEHETISIANILSHLNTDGPITAPPPQAQAQRRKRSLGERVRHFLFVGIPLALIVGVLAGILHCLKSLFDNLTTIITACRRLYSMSEQDVRFYRGMKVIVGYVPRQVH